MGIGADLKRAREEAGITLQAVSDKTKINIPFLEAIEREEWSVFPSQTFAKGFLRAYAKMVKVDPALATKQFNEEVSPSAVVVAPSYNIEAGPVQTALKFPASPKSAPPKKEEPRSVPSPHPTPAPPPVEREPRPAPAPAPAPRPAAPRATHHPRVAPAPPPRDLALEFDDKAAAEEHQAVARMLFTKQAGASIDARRWFRQALGLLALVVLLALVALGVRGIVHWAGGLRQAQVAENEEGVQPTPTEAPAPMRPVADNARNEAFQPKRVTTPKIPPRPVKRAVSAAAVAATPSAAVTVSPVPVSPTQAAAQAAVPADKYHHLILKGLESSWVLVVVDGRARSEFNLMPGQLRMFDALNGFQVKIGNAAGVDAQYDGKTLGVLGGRDQVIDFVLPHGYHPPAAP